MAIRFPPPRRTHSPPLVERPVPNGEHPHEAILLKLNITKAKEKLGWVPKWNLDRALKKTVSWYKCYYNGEDIHAMSLEQIEEYQVS